MGFLRGLGRATSLGLGLLLIAPVVALLPAACVDQGPDGAVRSTLFPFALVVLDPFVWGCARNSLVMSALVAAGSLVVGVPIARSVATWRYWGRAPLAALAFAPLVVPPMFGALGLRTLIDRGLWPGRFGDWGSWVAWAWVGLGSGVPLVALAAASALARVEPAWEQAAALVGAGRFRVWRQLIWPAIRPVAARAAAAVFTLTLVEPGAPLALGLRRTLAFQLVEAVQDTDPFPRAAILALEAVALVLLGRLLVRWWGGAPQPQRSPWPAPRARPAGLPRAAGFVAFLGASALFGWIPPLIFISLAFRSPLSLPSGATGPSAVVHRFVDESWRLLVVNSLIVSVVALAIDVVLARAIGSRSPRRRSMLNPLAKWPEAVPPLVFGVGALGIVRLIQISVAPLSTLQGVGLLARGARLLADGLDPVQSPGVLLALALAGTSLPALVRLVEFSQVRGGKTLLDAAINLGASERQARRVASRGWFGVPPGALVLAATLAATSLAPALILAPTAESRTVSPAILSLADDPRDGRTRAAALAAWVMGANLLALAWAYRSQTAPLDSWFHDAH